MIELKYYGHACFSLQAEKTTLIFDPFLTGNTFEIAKADEIKADYILVSHAHGDHIGDTEAIAKKNNATVISTAEIGHMLEAKNCKANPMHIGGKKKYPFGSVRLTLAFHGSGIPGGHACGFVVDFYGKVVYFAGDTGIFGDMELIGKLEKIDYALLPIGNNFTMGPEDAAIAAGMLGAKTVIPMHYNTWPLIEQDPEAFKELAEKTAKCKVLVVKPGETIEI